MTRSQRAGQTRHTSAVSAQLTECVRSFIITALVCVCVCSSLFTYAHICMSTNFALIKFMVYYTHAHTEPPTPSLPSETAATSHTICNDALSADMMRCRGLIHTHTHASKISCWHFFTTGNSLTIKRVVLTHTYIVRLVRGDQSARARRSVHQQNASG